MKCIYNVFDANCDIPEGWIDGWMDMTPSSPTHPLPLGGNPEVIICANNVSVFVFTVVPLFKTTHMGPRKCGLILQVVLK